MDGFFIKVKLVDSDPVTYPLKARAIIAAELKYGKGFVKMIGEDMKYEQICYMAYETLKANGATASNGVALPMFGNEFFDKLDYAELADDPSLESTATA